ncbi:MAG: hypothetical protein LC768_04915 [Acidobacteria bacterium]|nr:hypothetical protein [Acidobacteriota bacterium]MCA1637667.1 hypothetical protein [Acidobacteriota bacterium]
MKIKDISHRCYDKNYAGTVNQGNKSLTKKTYSFLKLTFFLSLFTLLIHPQFTGKFFAQTQPEKKSEIKPNNPNDLFDLEVKASDIEPEFLRKWSYKPDDLQPSKSLIQKQVRIVYLVPSDRVIRDDYKAAVADAILHLQDFYQKELGNSNAFSLHSPIVEVYQTTHTTSWYSTNKSNPGTMQPGWFVENLLADGFS